VKKQLNENLGSGYSGDLESNIAEVVDKQLQQQFQTALENELELCVGREVEAQLGARFGATCASDLNAEIANQVGEQMEEKLGPEVETKIKSYFQSLKAKATEWFRLSQDFLPEGLRLQLDLGHVLMAVVILWFCVSDIRYVLLIMLMFWWLRK